MKAKKKPLHHNTSDPAKIRENIIQQFESLPTDTRDIIAQFYIMTLSEKRQSPARRIRQEKIKCRFGVPLEHPGGNHEPDSRCIAGS